MEELGFLYAKSQLKVLYKRQKNRGLTPIVLS